MSVTLHQCPRCARWNQTFACPHCNPTTVPENKDAPCNICGRGWPHHEDACAYRQTALEADRYRNALQRIEHWPFDVGHDPENDLRKIREVAHDAIAD